MDCLEINSDCSAFLFRTGPSGTPASALGCKPIMVITKSPLACIKEREEREEREEKERMKRKEKKERNERKEKEKKSENRGQKKGEGEGRQKKV